MSSKLIRFFALGIGIALSCQMAQAGVSLNSAQRLITITPTGNYTADIRNAANWLVNRADKNVRYTVKFAPGKYSVTLPLYAPRGMENVDFVSDPANPAILMKAPNYSGSDFFWNIRFCKNISVSGFEFYGLTTFKNNADPVWGDQGLMFGSCNGVKVDRNKFYNYGNAALRVTTSEGDPVRGVNSFNTTVTNNIFNNIYQISTTSNDEIHGATANYLFQNNQVLNLRGSVKFASRTAGAKNVKVLNNTINGGDWFGLEIDNFSDFLIENNVIQNLKSVAINIYTNPRAPKGFAWGDNITIKGNTIKNCGRGIRFSADPFQDGFKYSPKNFVLENNILTNITDPTKSIAAIMVTNSGGINGMKVTYNKLNNIANKNYFYTSPSTTNVMLLGNMIDGKPVGPQPK